MKKKNLIFVLIWLTLAAKAQIPSNIPTNGLVGYWPFTGNANDLSTNANHGTVNGFMVLTTGRDSQVNCAYAFDGIDDHVVIDTQSLQSFTLSCWVNIKKINFLSFNGLISNLGSPFKGMELRILPDSTVELACGLSNTWLYVSTKQKLSGNRWYHVVATKNTDSAKIYLDGQQIASRKIMNFTNNESNIHFGTRDASSSHTRHIGKLDDIGIWNRALSQVEIGGIFKTGIDASNYIPAITLYPNPASSSININIDQGLTGSAYTICDLAGRQVFSGNFTGTNNEINIGNLAAGLYFVKIGDGFRVLKFIAE